MMAAEIDTITNDYPIGTDLDKVRESLRKVAEDPSQLDSASLDDLETQAESLLLQLWRHPAARQLSACSGSGDLRSDIDAFLANSAARGRIDRFKPLFRAILTNQSDVDIWKLVYRVIDVQESTPSPPQTPPQTQPILPFKQTPVRFSTDLPISTEQRSFMDALLRDELGVMYVGVPNFEKAFFGEIPNLETASKAIFEKCTEGTSPLFHQGWTGWPSDAKESGVLSWINDLFAQLLPWAQVYQSTTRRIRAQSNTPVRGSVAVRKLDIGFVDRANANATTVCHWSDILIPGELKCNPGNDIPCQARLDIARYVKEVFAAQPTRRFVLAFTICGTWMRLWEFDRAGAIASDKFDINKDGQRFVSTILGFLWMDDALLGFDPTILKSRGRQYIEIQRDGKTERLVLNELIRAPRCIVGRATTCWKAYLEGDKSTPYVIKDSWQCVERDDEGELLEEATAKGVTNIAQHYYHETVRVQSQDDDVEKNVRKGLDISKASNYGKNIADHWDSEASASGLSRGSKRRASQIAGSLPPSKRLRSSLTSARSSNPPRNPIPSNRIRRRLILRHFGKGIYRASSPSALLRAFEECIRGHEALYKAGFLHRDISINNMMINEDDDNNSPFAFLIDLDHAIRVNRTEASGASGITGTRAFMAIRVLKGQPHSFMDDLESFFWVLFWICVHLVEPGEHRVVPQFELWHSHALPTLGLIKLGIVASLDSDLQPLFTSFYEPLFPCLLNLRKIVFPQGRQWQVEDPRLWGKMIQVLRDARDAL